MKGVSRWGEEGSLKDEKNKFLFDINLYDREGPIASGRWLLGPYKAHTSVPNENLFQGGRSRGLCMWGCLNLIYRGGSFNYLLRGSANNIPMEIGTSTVTRDLSGREGVVWGLIPSALGHGSEYVQ